MMPEIQLYNRQRGQRPDMPWLRKVAKAAVPHCVAAAKVNESPLVQVAEVEISVVSDAEIARVHEDFLDDPTPTDVITFHHGEILISADTAVRQGAEHGLTLDRELALYLIHGLLHLGGWDDHDADEAAEMAGHQFRILDLVAPQR